MPSLTDAIRPAVEAAQAKAPDDLLREATIENVRLLVRHLETSQSLLSDRIAAGDLRVVGAVYDIESGRVTAV
ncbi:MAG: carbonic anhydrase [Alphaproteobacteria bacterium]